MQAGGEQRVVSAGGVEGGFSGRVLRQKSAHPPVPEALPRLLRLAPAVFVGREGHLFFALNREASLSARAL